ncbi:hypothetical protein CARN8_1540005 [mine drainage metagenome]|uniref:Uncharacterized protein n=1 Tax=mine drainage metagenome TaxID=410659 RepID=A0A3P3ZLU4_9ZZZZ
MALVGNGNGSHDNASLLHGKNILSRSMTPATANGNNLDLALGELDADYRYLEHSGMGVPCRGYSVMRLKIKMTS